MLGARSVDAREHSVGQAVRDYEHPSGGGGDILRVDSELEY